MKELYPILQQAQDERQIRLYSFVVSLSNHGLKSALEKRMNRVESGKALDRVKG